MKYNIFQNIGYTYKESIKRFPKVKYFLIINFITELLLPFSATVVTTLVVYALTNNVNIDQYVLLILALSLVTLLIGYLRFWSLSSYSWENVVTRNTTFSVRLAKYQLSADYPNIAPKSQQNKVNKAIEGIGGNFRGVELMLRNTLPALYNIVGIIIYGVMIVMYSPVILLILGAMTIVNYILTTKANMYMESKKEKTGKMYAEKYYLQEDMTNHKYGKDVRVYNMKNWFYNILYKLTKDRKLLEKKTEKRFLYSNLSDTFFLMIRDIIAYTTLVTMVISGVIDVTTFTFLMGIVTGFTIWLNGFVTSANNLRTSNIAINDYRSCMETTPVFNHEKGIDINSLTRPLEIEFKDVTFKYPDTNNIVLDKLSFKISKGKKVALVGENGAGKTTIVLLLCGLYQPTSGNIYINGHDINEFNIEEYVKLLSVVFQDSEPLAFSIAQNISCKKEDDIDYEKVKECIKLAGLETKINSLENKENSYISQMFHKDGIKLSGGEIQKLMLARALYKEASFLILDEPTAALDPISEEEMYLKYDQLLKGNTSIFISHRLSSTKFCDSIIYLANGKIVEEGSHDKLINHNGYYKELFDIQAQYYKEDTVNEKY